MNIKYFIIGSKKKKNKIINVLRNELNKKQKHKYNLKFSVYSYTYINCYKTRFHWNWGRSLENEIKILYIESKFFLNYRNYCYFYRLTYSIFLPFLVFDDNTWLEHRRRYFFLSPKNSLKEVLNFFLLLTFRKLLIC